MTDAESFAPLHTPLCPAGHLPLKGGDYAGIVARAKLQGFRGRAGGTAGSISPLEGEMSGRTEGGVKGQKTKKDVHKNNDLQTSTHPKRPPISPSGRRGLCRAPRSPAAKRRYGRERKQTRRGKKEARLPYAAFLKRSRSCGAA